MNTQTGLFVVAFKKERKERWKEAEDGCKTKTN